MFFNKQVSIFNLSRLNWHYIIWLTDDGAITEHQLVHKLYIKHVSTLYDEVPGPGLHPKLEGVIRAYVKDRVLVSRNGMPGLHAEVQALNEAFHTLTKQGRALTEAELGGIEIATYRTSGKKKGRPFSRCENCQALVKSPPIKILTDGGNSALTGSK